MAKKDKQKKHNVTEKKGKSLIPWVVVGIILVAVVIVVVVSGKIPFSGTDEKKGKSFHIQGGETRPILDPSLFTGMTRAAYAAAKEYPEVMDQVYCYCYCNEPPFNHKSLLSCFTERHGAG